MAEHVQHTHPGQASSDVAERITALIHLLAEQDGSRVARARRELIAIGRAAGPALVQALRSENPRIRREVVKVLQDLRDPQAAPVLVDLLEDNVFEVRWGAARALIALGRIGLEPLLQRLIERPSSRQLREGACHIVRYYVDKGLYKTVHPLQTALESQVPEVDLPRVARQALDELLAAAG